MIRQATSDDAEAVKPLISMFYNEILGDLGANHSDEYVDRCVANIDNSIYFISESNGRITGVIGGVLVDSFFDSKKIFQEIIWYVDKKERITVGMRLFDKLEEYCKNIGVKKMVMARMHSEQGGKIENFYLRHGYNPVETHYLKEL